MLLVLSLERKILCIWLLGLPRWFNGFMKPFPTHEHDLVPAQNDLHIVQFLHEHRSEARTTKATNDAAGFGDIHIVQYLDDNRSEEMQTR